MTRGLRLVLAAALAAFAWAGAGSSQALGAQRASASAVAAPPLCTAQSQIQDRAFADMFDRGYQIVCRDAAVPVGQLYVLRNRGGTPPRGSRRCARTGSTCDGPERVEIEGLGAIESLNCRLIAADEQRRN